jgi:uncharacterized membrane protein
MNWILGLIGAFLGGLISENDTLMGVVFGFFALFLASAHARLRGRVTTAEQELQQLRHRLASLSAATTKTEPPPTAEAPVAAPEPVVAASEAEIPEPSVARETTAVAEPATSAEEVSVASARVSEPSAGEPPPIPPQTPRAPRLRAEPDWMEKSIGVVKRWFTEGNVPVKIGVLVLFAGVAAALRYAAAQGYFTFPIEFRMAAIAAGALIGLAFGWRERERKPAFALSLQGGALGVLMLTVFASYRLWSLLPPTLAFVLVVVLVAGAALLSILQNNMALAVLGFLGGYLAPVLISTGSHNHVALFSYYALLNAAVFGVSWKRSWRALNLVGFAFTFGVGTAWGVQFYRPDLFGSVEPFLILFFLFYVLIGLLYVIRQTEHRRPFVDGTLVFGTPLLAFPLQAGLLKDDKMSLAFSALVVGLVYGGLVYWLRKHRDEKLLTQAYAILAMGFATLAVPLAFSAGTTASVWALEGAGVAWLGIRQDRWFPWLSGLGLQLLAAIAFLFGYLDGINAYDVNAHMLLLNPHFLGAAVLAFSGFALSLIHDRHRPVPALPLLLFGWAVFWWLFGWFDQMHQAKDMVLGASRFGVLYLAVSAALVALLRQRLQWPRLHWLLPLVAVLGLIMVFSADSEFHSPLATEMLATWSAYLLAMGYALWTARDSEQRSPSVAHLALLWSVAAAATMQLVDFVDDDLHLAEGWQYMGWIAPLLLMTLGLWRRRQWLAWPRADAFPGYSIGWYALAFPMLIVLWLFGVFLEGNAAPLLYVPLLNPLEAGLIAIAALLFWYLNETPPRRPLLKVWPYVGFLFVTLATLRGVHHWHGEPWGVTVLNSGFSQASLTVVWSLIGVGSMLLGSRRVQRPLWLGGVILMVVVLAKLALIDRHYAGNIPGIVSFFVVGLLLVAVGYFAPSPPKTAEGAPS